MVKEQGSRLFSPEELIKARSPRRRWAGKPIGRTKDCDVCLFHLEHDRGAETCEWGTTWKVLVVEEKAEAACAKLGGSRPSPRGEKILGSRPRRDTGRGILLDSKIRVLPWEE